MNETGDLNPLQLPLVRGRAEPAPPLIMGGWEVVRCMRFEFEHHHIASVIVSAKQIAFSPYIHWLYFVSFLYNFSSGIGELCRK
jgi:hypothetical protein